MIDSEQDSVQYNFIHICLWCELEYNVEESNASVPEFYCSQKCQLNDEELEYA